MDILTNEKKERNEKVEKPTKPFWMEGLNSLAKLGKGKRISLLKIEKVTTKPS